MVAGVGAVVVLGVIAFLVFGGAGAPDPAAGPTTPSGILSPSPVTSGPTVGPTDSPPPPPPAPGDTRRVGEAFDLTVPAGFSVVKETEDRIDIFDPPNGVYIVGQQLAPDADPAADMVAEAETQADAWAASNGSQVDVGDAVALPTTGGITGIASTTFSYLYTDEQSTKPYEGLMFTAVRQDGILIRIVVDVPGDLLTATESIWKPITDAAIASFGG